MIASYKICASRGRGNGWVQQLEIGGSDSTNAITSVGKDNNRVSMYPLNVAADGVCCTINTRYENLIAPNHIMNLAHYPRTVLLYEYDPSALYPAPAPHLLRP